MKTSKPIIGIIPDFREGSIGGYSVKEYYAIRKNHIDTITKNGGAVIIIPYDYDLITNYLGLIDGLLIVGGYFDINPKRYNEKIHSSVKLNETRENFEFAVVEKALEIKIPFFGICNGMQVLNIIKGGSAIQNIPDDPKYFDHEQQNTEGFNDYKIPFHEVNIDKTSKLFSLVKKESFKTNSSHHQGIKELGSNLVACAKAQDGIIEGIEDPHHPFCIGVQWHPEYESSEVDNELFKEFVKASLIYKIDKIS